jgi:hypothetical protein
MRGVIACAAYAGGRRVGDVLIPDISEALKEPDRFVWIGLHEPDTELLREIQQEFGLHDLAVEDALAARARLALRLPACGRRDARGVRVPLLPLQALRLALSRISGGLPAAALAGSPR